MASTVGSARGDTSGHVMKRSDRKLMARVGREHYIEGLSNTEIGEQLGISRFKVARLLERALEEGIVKIQVVETGLPDGEMGAKLAEHLGLARCIVVRAEGDEAEVRRQVGAEAAELLSDTLVEGEILGVSWGQTLTDTTSQVESLPPLTIVQLTGFLSDDLQTSPIEVAQGVAAHSGGRVFPLFVPLYVQDEDMAARLREHPDLKRVMALYPRVTTALLSVGGWNPPNTQVREVLPANMREEAVRLGCVADVAGIMVGENGRPIDPSFENRTLGISYKELVAVPRVVAVAAGAGKAEAIASVAKGGVITELVVDDALAEELLGKF